MVTLPNPKQENVRRIWENAENIRNDLKFIRLDVSDKERIARKLNEVSQLLGRIENLDESCIAEIAENLNQIKSAIDSKIITDFQQFEALIDDLLKKIQILSDGGGYIKHMKKFIKLIFVSVSLILGFVILLLFIRSIIYDIFSIKPENCSENITWLSSHKDLNDVYQLSPQHPSMSFHVLFPESIGTYYFNVVLNSTYLTELDPQLVSSNPNVDSGLLKRVNLGGGQYEFIAKSGEYNLEVHSNSSQAIDFKISNYQIRQLLCMVPTSQDRGIYVYLDPTSSAKTINNNDYYSLFRNTVYVTNYLSNGEGYWYEISYPVVKGREKGWVKSEDLEMNLSLYNDCRYYSIP